MDTQQQIQLGQAENQATQILKGIWFNSFSDDRERMYKEMVKTIYQWNRDLEVELENSLKTKEEPVKSIPPLSPNDSKVSKQAFPSLRQKYCPKCKIIIPKTWTKHIECGWVE